MLYNFDTIVDRSQNYSAKYDETNLYFGVTDVLPLWVADMDFRTANPIIESLKNRVEQGIFGYTTRPEEYFASIIQWQEKRNQYRYDIGTAAYAPGVIPGMRIFLQAFTKPDAKILVQQPVYHPFMNIVRNTGRTLVVNELVCGDGGSYGIDFDDFEKKIREGVTHFILCSPHNPVGRVWTLDELRTMGEICLNHGVEILADEIHSDLILRGKHIATANLSQEIAAITTTFISPSKTFNLAGLQSSTIFFNSIERKEAYVVELKKMDIARNNCFSLVASMAAYSEGGEWLEQLLPYLRDNIRFVRDYCQEFIPGFIPNDPEATYLVWIDTRGLGMTEDALMKILLEKAGVALNRGSDFGAGGTGFLRLNAACPRSVLEKALGRIRSAIAR